uniref:uncharacterized protein LOC123462788 n=1 Tax=Jaculus jaculus TaxID=51337 RepID=UPI001E1B0D78|nr:uncharacterized protein LOC123462788 [Jaculus jaculus]
METHEEVKAATNIEVTSEEKEASQKSSLYSPPKSTSEHLPQETKAASIHATTAQEGALMTNEQSKEAAKVQEVTSKVQEAIDEGSETDMSLSFFDQLSQRETSTTYDQIKGAAADCALTTELQKDSHDNKKISNSRVWKGSLGDNETDESLSISWLHSEKKEVDNIYATLAERGQHMSNVQKKAVTAMKIKEDKANLSGSDKSLSWSTFKSLSEIKEDFHMTTHQRQKSMTYSQIKAAEPIVKTEGGQDSHDDNDKPEPWSTSESISEIKEDCHMTIHQIQKFMTHFSQIKETSTVCAVAPERQKTSHGDSEMDIPRSISEPLSEKKKDSHISIAQRPKQTTHSQRKEVSADYAVKPVIQKTSHGDSEMDISMCIPESLSEKKEIDSICDTSTKARQQMANEQVKVPEPIVKIEASRDSHGDDDKAESQSISEPLSEKKEHDHITIAQSPKPTTHSKIQDALPDHPVKPEIQKASHGYSKMDRPLTLWRMPVIPAIGKEWEEYHCQSKANQRKQSEFQKLIHDTLSKKKEDDNVRGTTTKARQQRSNIQVKVPEPIVKIEASRDSHGDDDKAESQELRHMPVIPPIGRQWEDYHCESKANQRQQSEFQKIIHDTLSKKKEDDNVRGTTTNARQQMSNIQVKVPEPIVKIEASRDSHGDDDKAESQELRHMPVIPPIGRQWEDYHCESKANQRQQSEFQKIIHDTLSKKKEDDNVRGTTTNARQQMSNIQVKEAEPTVKREGSRDSHGDGDKAESRNISEPLSNKKEDVHMTVAPRSKHMTHSQIKAAESIVKIEGGRKSHGDGDKAESRSISEPLSKTKGDGHITIAQRPKHTTHSQSKEASEDHTVKPEIQKVSHGNSEMDIPKHIPESPSEVKEADNLHGTTTEARQRPANVQIKAAEPIMKIEGSRNSHGDSDKAESQQRISESLSKKKEVDNLQDTTTKARQGMSNVQIKAAEPVVKIEGGRDNHSDSYKAESRSISEPHSSKKEDGHINVAQRPKHPTHSQIKEPSADDTAKPEIQKTSHRDSKMDLLMQRIPESLPEKKEVDNVPGTTTKAGQRMANVQIKAAEPIMKVEGSRDSHGDSDKAESRSISEPLSKKKEDGPISITQRKQTTHSKIKEASEVHTVTPEIQKASRGDSEMDIPMQRISESLSEKKEVDNLQDTTTKARQRNSNVQIKAAEPVVNIEGGHDSHSDSYKAESRSISEPRSNKKEDGHKTIAKRPKHTKHSQIKETSADHTAKPEIKKASHRDSKMGLLTPMPESLSEKKDVDNLQDTTTKARQQISKVQIKAAEPVVNIEGGHDSHSNSYKAESRQSISEPHSSKKEDGHKTIAQRPKHGKHSRIKEASADHTAKPEIQKASHRDSKMDLLKQHMPESLSEKKEVDNLQDATTKARQQMSKVQIKAAEPVVKIEGDRDSHTDSYKTESQQSISEPHSSKKEDGHKTIAKRPKHAKHSQIKEASADHTAEPEIQEASHRDSKMDLLTHMSESLSEKKEVDNLQDTTTKARQQMSKVQIKATEPVLKIESGRDSHSDSYKAESQQSISEPHSSKKEDGHKTIAQQPEHAKHSQIKEASADHTAKPEIKKASRRGRKMGLLTCMCRCVSGKKEVDNVQDTTTEARQQMSEVQIKAAEPVVKIESSRDSHSDSHKAESQQSISEPHSSKKEDGHKTIAQRQKHGTHSQIKEASADHTTKPEVQKASHRDSKMDLLTQHMSESHSEKKEVDNLQDTTTKTRQQMSKVQIKAAEPVVKIESSHNSHSDSYKAESQQSISEPHSSKKEDGHKTIAQRQKHGTHSQIKEASADHTTKPEVQKASHRDSKMDLLTQHMSESHSEKKEVDNLQDTTTKTRQQMSKVQIKAAEPVVKIESSHNSHSDSYKAESQQSISEPHSSKKEDGHKTIAQRQKHGTHSQIKEASADHTTKPEVQKASHRDSKMDLLTQHMSESHSEKKEVDNLQDTTTKTRQQMSKVQIKAAEPVVKIESSRDSHSDSHKAESQQSISEPHSSKKEDGHKTIAQRQKHGTHSQIKEASADHTTKPEVQKASHRDSKMDLLTQHMSESHSEKKEVDNLQDTTTKTRQQMSKVQIKAAEPVVKIESSHNSHSDSYKAESQQSISEPHSSKKEDGHKTIAQRQKHGTHSHTKEASTDHTTKPEIQKASHRDSKTDLLTRIPESLSEKEEVDNICGTAIKARQQLANVQTKEAEPTVKIEVGQNSHGDSDKAESWQRIPESLPEKKEVDNVPGTTTKAGQQMANVQIKAAEPIMKVEGSRDSHGDSDKTESRSISEPLSKKKEDGPISISQRRKQTTLSKIKEALAVHTLTPEIQKASRGDSEMDIPMVEEKQKTHQSNEMDISEKTYYSNVSDTENDLTQQSQGKTSEKPQNLVQMKEHARLAFKQEAEQGKDVYMLSENMKKQLQKIEKKYEKEVKVRKQLEMSLRAQDVELKRWKKTKEIEDENIMLKKKLVEFEHSLKSTAHDLNEKIVGLEKKLQRYTDLLEEATKRSSNSKNEGIPHDTKHFYHKIEIINTTHEHKVSRLEHTTEKLKSKLFEMETQNCLATIKTEKYKTLDQEVRVRKAQKQSMCPVQFTMETDQRRSEPEDLRTANVNPRSSVESPNFNLARLKEQYLKKLQCNQNSSDRSSQKYPLTHLLNECNNRNTKEESETSSRLPKRPVQFSLGTDQRHSEPEDLRTANVNPRSSVESPNFNLAKPKEQYLKKLQCNQNSSDRSSQKYPLTHLLNECNNRNTKEESETSSRLPKRPVQFSLGTDQRHSEPEDLRTANVNPRSSVESPNFNLAKPKEQYLKKLQCNQNSSDRSSQKYPLTHLLNECNNRNTKEESETSSRLPKRPVQFSLGTDQRHSEPEDLRTANVNPRSSVESPNFNLAKPKEQYLKKLQCNQNSSDRSSQKYPLTHLLNECNNRNTKEESETSSRLPKRPVQFSLGTDQRHSEPEDLRTANVNPRSSVESPNFNLAKPKEQYLKKLQCNQNSSDRSSQKYPLTHLLNECNNRNTKEESETSSRLPKRPVQFSLGTDQRHSEPEDLRTANVNPRSSVESPNFNLAKPKEQYLKKLQCNQNSSDRSSQKYPLTHLLNECNNRNTKEESETSSRLPKRPVQFSLGTDQRHSEPEDLRTANVNPRSSVESPNFNLAKLQDQNVKNRQCDQNSSHRSSQKCPLTHLLHECNDRNTKEESETSSRLPNMQVTDEAIVENRRVCICLCPCHKSTRQSSLETSQGSSLTEDLMTARANPRSSVQSTSAELARLQPEDYVKNRQCNLNASHIRPPQYPVTDLQCRTGEKKSKEAWETTSHRPSNSTRQSGTGVSQGSPPSEDPMKFHTIPKSSECAFCSHSSTRKSNMGVSQGSPPSEDTMKFHTIPKSSDCAFCSHSSTRQSNMGVSQGSPPSEDPMKFHTIPKSTECAFCSHSSTRQSNMGVSQGSPPSEDPMKFHTIPKSTECAFCSHSSTRQSNMGVSQGSPPSEDPMKFHTIPKSTECAFCSHSSTRQSNMGVSQGSPPSEDPVKFHTIPKSSECAFCPPHSSRRQSGTWVSQGSPPSEDPMQFHRIPKSTDCAFCSHSSTRKSNMGVSQGSPPSEDPMKFHTIPKSSECAFCPPHSSRRQSGTWVSQGSPPSEDPMQFHTIPESSECPFCPPHNSRRQSSMGISQGYPPREDLMQSHTIPRSSVGAFYSPHSSTRLDYYGLSQRHCRKKRKSGFQLWLESEQKMEIYRARVEAYEFLRYAYRPQNPTGCSSLDYPYVDLLQGLYDTSSDDESEITFY